MVYEADDGPSMILAQTDPPILKSMVDKEIFVTYMAREKKGMARFGFGARVTGFIESYKLNSSLEVAAVTVKKVGDACPYSIRMFYRVEPTSKSNLSAKVFVRDVNVLDISLGGMKFSFDKTLVVDPGNAVDIYLTLDGKPHMIEARILRVWDGDPGRSPPGIRFASAQFHNMARSLEAALSRKIREIEREGRCD